MLFDNITYEITESQRREIMQMLEWAEWAIREHMERDTAAGLRPEAVGLRRAALEQENAAMGELWDAVNALKPIINRQEA